MVRFFQCAAYRIDERHTVITQIINRRNRKMAALTQTQIDALVAKLQYYKYAVSFGETLLGPLKSPPKVEADIETKDTVIYETGVDPLASVISKNNAKITLELEDVDQAMTMLAAFKKGDNLLDSGNAKSLSLAPLTDDAGAKTLTFDNCYLQPGLATNFAEGDDPNHITLNFIAKPVVDTGLLFTFAQGQVWHGQILSKTKTDTRMDSNR
eukprot:TRINITY_DN2254_c0_g1_i1.p2 TRINITY_DN2254_c0_g1~~TRINITY_DN2254_c0_g1_i1.p2  ORF type:complete len:211 (+),score=29.02 TRINITY_DN2254_c0_g1_i1:210-842(+)